MKSPALIARLVTLEAKLDPILFRKKMDDEETADDHKSVAGSLAALGLAGGAYAGHRAVKSAGGYQAVGDKAMGKASDFLKGRKGAAMAGADAGRKAGMDLAGKAGGLVDRAAVAAPQYANAASRHVATGIAAAKTGALDVIKTLKKKLPMLVPHLSRIGLQETFNGKLVELDESLDSFLDARDSKKKRQKIATVAGAATAGVGAALGHRLVKSKGGYGSVAKRLLKMAA